MEYDMREGLTEPPGSLEAADGHTPVPSRSPWTRRAAFLVAVLFAILAGSRGESFFQVSDAAHYLRLAHGDPQVMQPFASRQLGPLIVRAAAALLHTSVEHAFIAQGVFSLLVVAGFVFFAVRSSARDDTPGWLLAAMAVVPFWPETFHDLALPDLWYAALLAAFLLLLQRERWLGAACMMFPLMLSRESTSLTLLCLLIAGWRELRWAGRVTAAGAAALGSLVTARLTAGSPGNPEHLPGFLYLLLKLPWNFVRLLGIRPWSDRDQLLCSVPRWQMPLHLGQMKAVGVCSVSLTSPLLALSSMTSLFGLLPLIAFWMWLRSRRTASRSLLLRFALLYGGISFVLAPAIGVSYARLFGYAWPLVLVAMPLLAAEPGVRFLLQSERAHRPLLLGLHAAACAASLAHVWWNAGMSVLAWVAAFVLLYRNSGAGSGSAPGIKPSGRPTRVM